ncbi:caspase activity and apoptosis inhibitor 1 [Genypterus blacodes]|uniref:caspase activity and apoptosis inhibitor 1 n=1 Tax=Genypterus blacodes TaxID=154954 RepID=UPI003F76DEBB
MLKKKSNGSEKKRKHSQSEERRENNKRRSAESNQEREAKDELADAELDRIGSDIEEGGLDLSMPFQPITAYVGDRREMLEQCFRVLGEKKLQKMLPDELKGCSFEEIKTLCWEQLEQVSLKNLLQILAGEDLTPGDLDENTEETSESQQDSNVDSTSCLKESAKTETDDPKQEAGGSGEESDVLSINADTYDSDIEGPKEEQSAKAVEAPLRVEGSNSEGAEPAAKPTAANPEIVKDSKPVEAKKDIQMDIDRSVSEILAFSNTLNKEEADKQSAPAQASAAAAAVASASVPAAASVSAAAAAAASPVESGPSSSRALAPGQPSVQQLELLELEMRARAIKALMKASNGKKNPEAN